MKNTHSLLACNPHTCTCENSWVPVILNCYTCIRIKRTHEHNMCADDNIQNYLKHGSKETFHHLTTQGKRTETSLVIQQNKSTISHVRHITIKSALTKKLNLNKMAVVFV